MNPTTEYRANPFHEKELLRYVALYKLTEGMDAPLPLPKGDKDQKDKNSKNIEESSKSHQPPPTTLATIPHITLMADICHAFDYRHASYMAALYRAIREVQYISQQTPTTSNENGQKGQNGQNGTKSTQPSTKSTIDTGKVQPIDTQRVRLSHEEFEIHLQTIVLPDIPQTTPKSLKKDQNSQDSSPTPPHRDESTSIDEDKRDDEEVEGQDEDDTTKSRHQKKQIEKKSTTLTTKLEPKAPKMATYLLFVVTDFNFVIEYSISSFFKDFTTQLAFIFTSPLAKPPTMINDKRFFVLMGQLYNRYVVTRKLSAEAHIKYDNYIRLQRIQQQQKLEEKRRKEEEEKEKEEQIEEKDCEENEKGCEEKENEKNQKETEEKTETKTTPITPKLKTISPEALIPEVTLFTTVDSINYTNINTNPRKITISTLHDEEQLDFVNTAANTPELLTFTTGLIYEHQWIPMTAGNTTFIPDGITHLFGIPLRFYHYAIVILTQMVVMAIMYYVFYAFGLMGDDEGTGKAVKGVVEPAQGQLGEVIGAIIADSTTTSASSVPV